MVPLELSALILGILLRLAIPVGGTVLAVWILLRLDARWREEPVLKDNIKVDGVEIPIYLAHCWEVRDCSPEQLRTCMAYKNPDLHCWDVVRANGRLQEACQKCQYRQKVLTSLAV